MSTTPLDMSTFEPEKEPALDMSTFQPAQSSSPFNAENSEKAYRSAVYGHMLDTPPSFAYHNMEEVDQKIREKAGDDFDKGIVYAAKTGFEATPLGLIIRGKSPEPFNSHSKLGNFIHDVSEVVSDPLILASAFSAPEGVGLGGFAADAALRKMLMDQYQKGGAKDFGELAERAGSILWEGAKGAMVGKAGMAAGELPVGKLLTKSSLASAGMKGLYQSAVMTTAGSLLNGQLPNVEDFERSAALIVPLNVVSHGAFLRKPEVKQAQMDVYGETGVTPEESALKQQAQPTVKPDLPEGLRPAIKVGDGVIEGDTGEQHTDLAARLGSKPVSMNELQADPSKAEKVLQEPQTHEQSVIDEALKLKREELEGGSGETPEYDPASMKSGRGFVTPEGKFLTREQAKNWMKENEPEVHKMWTDMMDDAKAELHSEDYGIARFRLTNRNLMEGEPDYKGMSPELSNFLSIARGELKSIPDLDTKYGHVLTRSLWDGPRKFLRAQGEQIASRMRSLLPKSLDQEALSFLRDYRDDPEALRTAIEQVREGSNNKLKAFIPAMERALNPSPEMIQADSELTQYYTQALDLARQVGTLDSTIDPSRYSPRLFEVEGGKGMKRSKMTSSTPHSIQRQYRHMLDPLQSGSVEARTFNAIDELGIYADRHSTSIATKLWTTELKNSKLGTEGTEDSHPDGWKKLTPQSDFYVPEKIAKSMKPMLDSGESTLAKDLHVQAIIKGIQLTLSLFHGKALTFVAMNNMQLDAYGKALLTSNTSPEFEAGERFGALYGLETTKTGQPYEAYQGLKSSSLPEESKSWVGRGLNQLKDTSVVKSADAVMKAQTKWLFDGVQRRFKVIDFTTRAHTWEVSHPDATPAEYGKAMRGIAKEVNSGYGGLNWDVMGVSKGYRDLARIILLAPDWTFSNFLQAKYAFEGGPGGAAARSFWLRSFATGIAMTQATSYFMSGQFSKHPTMVYLGEENGKEKYSNWYFSAAPKDAITLGSKVMSKELIGAAEFIVGKASPFLGTLYGLAANKAYGGKLISKPGDSSGQQFKDQSKYVGGKLLPITVSTVLKLLTDDKEHSWMEYVGAVVGQTTVSEGSQTAAPTGPGKRKTPIGKTRPGAKRR